MVIKRNLICNCNFYGLLICCPCRVKTCRYTYKLILKITLRKSIYLNILEYMYIYTAIYIYIYVYIIYYIHMCRFLFQISFHFFHFTVSPIFRYGLTAYSWPWPSSSLSASSAATALCTSFIVSLPPSRKLSINVAIYCRFIAFLYRNYVALIYIRAHQ